MYMFSFKDVFNTGICIILGKNRKKYIYSWILMSYINYPDNRCSLSLQI